MCFQGQLVPLPQIDSHIDCIIKVNSSRWFLCAVQFFYHFIYYSSLQNEIPYYCAQIMKTTYYVQYYTFSHERFTWRKLHFI